MWAFGLVDEETQSPNLLVFRTQANQKTSRRTSSTAASKLARLKYQIFKPAYTQKPCTESRARHIAPAKKISIGSVRVRKWIRNFPPRISSIPNAARFFNSPPSPHMLPGRIYEAYTHNLRGCTGARNTGPPRFLIRIFPRRWIIFTPPPHPPRVFRIRALDYWRVSFLSIGI